MKCLIDHPPESLTGAIRAYTDAVVHATMDEWLNGPELSANEERRARTVARRLGPQPLIHLALQGF